MLTILIAISLSMDAFSLSLAYGTLGISKKEIIKLSIIVGIYHFFMPLAGMIIGSKLFHLIPFKPVIIVFVILSLIGIQMIIESFKKETYSSLMSFKELLLFGFAVSVDSFSVGIGLKAINPNYYFCAFMFSIFSLLFTYLGLILGNRINSLLGKKATILGGLSLIVIGFVYLFG